MGERNRQSLRWASEGSAGIPLTCPSECFKVEGKAAQGKPVPGEGEGMG